MALSLVLILVHINMDTHIHLHLHVHIHIHCMPVPITLPVRFTVSTRCFHPALSLKMKSAYALSGPLHLLPKQ